MHTKMKNLNVIKVHPFEIAKAHDVDKSFRDILTHLGLFASYCFGYHAPMVDVRKPDLALDEEGKPEDYQAVGEEREIKAFVVGGGLEQGSAIGTLRLLPIIAVNSEGELFISSGKNYEGKDIEISLVTQVFEYTNGEGREIKYNYSPEATDQIFEEYRGNTERIYYNKRFNVISIYLGDAQDNENRPREEPVYFTMQDLTWEEFEYQWRFTGHTEGCLKEYAKRQTQSIRLYALHGKIVADYKQAKAPETPDDKYWKRRVKIAEVLVSYTMPDQNGLAVMDPIRKDDIHFVTASQYWEDQRDDGYHQSDGQSSYEKADARWLEHVPNKDIGNKINPYSDNYTAKSKKLWAKVQDELAFRAEHYNYRWTNERTKTYSLGSMAEISERIHKIHKKDGTLKEGVVNRENIYLQPMDEGDKHSLRGEHISIMHVREIDKQNGISPEIPLQYENSNKNQISINDYDSIATGFRKVGKALREGNLKVDAEIERLTSNDLKLQEQINEDRKIRERHRIEVRDRILGHEADLSPHGATADATPQRIVLRDGNGNFKITMPSSAVDKYNAVNVEYVDYRFKNFRQTLFPELLYVQLVSCQADMDAWIAYNDPANGTKYKIVYLQGEFTLENKDIDLAQIGTEQVIGVPNREGNQPVLNIIRNGVKIHWEGIAGYYGERPSFVEGNKYGIIKNVTIKATGCVFENNDMGTRLAGVARTTCVDCTIEVTGEKYKIKSGKTTVKPFHFGTDVFGAIECSVENCTIKAKACEGNNGRNGADRSDNSYNGENGWPGAWAIALHKCDYVKGCSVYAFGGNGGNGGRGYDGTPHRNSAGRGGHGGNGGDASSAQESNITEESFISEKVIGGNGGKGGNGGDSCLSNKGGAGGRGGDGGDVYFSEWCNNYKVGSGGTGGRSEDPEHPGADGGDGDAGRAYLIR